MTLYQREIIDQLKELGYYYSITYSDEYSAIFVDDLLARDVAITADYNEKTIIISSFSSIDLYVPVPAKVLSLIAKFIENGGDDEFWQTLPADTKVLVSCDGETWFKRYFAKYENKQYYAWDDGKTSWTAKANELTSWKYMKVPDEEKDI